MSPTSADPPQRTVLASLRSRLDLIPHNENVGGQWGCHGPPADIVHSTYGPNSYQQIKVPVYSGIIAVLELPRIEGNRVRRSEWGALMVNRFRCCCVATPPRHRKPPASHKRLLAALI